MSEAVVEVHRGSELLGRSRVELAPPDDTGLIRYLGALPVDRFGPGFYSVRVAVIAGDKAVSRSVQIQLTD